MSQLHVKHYCCKGLKLEFDHPEDWHVDVENSSTGKISALKVLAPAKSNSDQKTTFILEIDSCTEASDINLLLKDLKTDLALKYEKFELINNQVSKSKSDHSKGFVIFKHQRDGQEFVSQKVLFLYPKKRCIHATASATSSEWLNHKSCFQMILSSLRQYEDKDIEIVFSSEDNLSVKTHTTPPLTNQSHGHPEEVTKLLQTEYSLRDQVWFQNVLSAINRTALLVGMQPVVRGPDGFSYYAFFTRQPSSIPINKQVRLPDVLTSLTDDGLGVVIDPDTPHVISFSFGEMWYARTHGGQLVPCTTSLPTESPPANAKIISGAPTTELLPDFARRTLKSYFKYVLKIKDPALKHSIWFNGEKAHQYFTFNHFGESYASEEEYLNACKGIGWHLPPDIGLLFHLQAHRDVIKSLHPL